MIYFEFTFMKKIVILFLEFQIVYMKLINKSETIKKIRIFFKTV